MSQEAADPSKARILRRDFVNMFTPGLHRGMPLYQEKCAVWVRARMSEFNGFLLNFCSNDDRIASGNAVEKLGVFFEGISNRALQATPYLFHRVSLEEAKSWVPILEEGYENPNGIIAYGPQLVSYVWSRVSSGLVWDITERRSSLVYKDEEKVEWFFRAIQHPELFNGSGEPPLGITRDRLREISSFPVTVAKMWAVPSDLYRKDLDDIKEFEKVLLSGMPKSRNINSFERAIRDAYSNHATTLVQILPSFPSNEWKFLTKVFFDGVSISGLKRFFDDNPGRSYDYIPRPLVDAWVNFFSDENINRAIELTGNNTAFGLSYFQTACIDDFNELKWSRIYSLSQNPREWMIRALETKDELSRITPLGLSDEKLSEIAEVGEIITRFAKPELRK